MGSVHRVSKVTPIQVQPAKRSKPIEDESQNIIHQFKHMIYVQSCLGISRVYLLLDNKILRWLSYFNSIFLLCLCIFFMTETNLQLSTSSQVIQYIARVQFVILISNALFAKKNKLKYLFKNLNAFDTMLNIEKDINVLSSAKCATFWMLGSFLYNLFGYMTVIISLSPTSLVDYTVVFYNVMYLAQDFELIFFVILLRNVYLRAVVMKTHVCKVFPGSVKETDNKKKLDKVETLSKNAQLDITSLHRAYELLHKCSEQLNSIISFPVLIVFLCSGLSTTMLLKVLVGILLNFDKIQLEFAVVTLILIWTRCWKYALLVIVPCYYCSITVSQASVIRNTLHNAGNTMEVDKLKRRKVKAFFLLTKENEFAYALYGVIGLNMTLLLSYASLCATYVVIIIQFTKFID